VKHIQLLEQYASLDQSEWGETCSALIALYSCRAHLSDQLIAVLEKEIEDQYLWAKENLRIVEITETIVQKRKEVMFVDDVEEESNEQIH